VTDPRPNASQPPADGAPARPDASPPSGPLEIEFLPDLSDDDLEECESSYGQLEVLVADDDPVGRMLVSRVLRNHGFAVFEAKDGTEARELFQQRHFPIVITDWRMPGVDGIELCRQIRAARLPNYTYIIILTSAEEKQHRIEGLSAGADDYITKPCSAQEIEVRLRAAQRILRLETELQAVNRQLIRMNSRLQKMSRLDPLMEIGNRLAFEETMEQFHPKAEQSEQRYSLVMCDVDHFKEHNDRFGHQSGDKVLREIAAAIQARLRSSDRAYRYGGEEIVLVLAHQDVSGATAAAERVRRSVAASRFFTEGHDHPLRVTISCGVASYPSGLGRRQGWRAVIAAADRALYEAKARGRNCTVAAMPGPHGCHFQPAGEGFREKSGASASEQEKTEEAAGRDR